MSEPVYRVQSSGCIMHPPGTPRHMCIHESSIWVQGPDGWYQISRIKSMFRAQVWLSECSTWDDVLAIADDLGLEGPQ